MGAEVTACVVVCCIGLITAGILIGVSFSSLGPNEVGLNYSTNSKTIEFSKLYENGVYFLGVGHNFIKYSKSVQTVNLKGRNGIQARTQDGLAVLLEITFNYRLVPTADGLGALYLLFEQDHEAGFTDIARSVVRNVAGTYNAFEFWTSRENITTSIFNNLNTRLTDFSARVDSLLLTNYDLPDSFQQAITDTDVAFQEINRVQFEVQNEQTKQTTRLQEAARQATIIMLQANATAQSVSLNAAAEIVRINSTVSAEIASLTPLKAALNFTSEDLNRFVWLDSISKSSVPKVFELGLRTTLQP